MKPLDELDHYEVLEIPPGAGFEDIQPAYRITRASYARGSMPTLSSRTTIAHAGHRRPGARHRDRKSVV